MKYGYARVSTDDQKADLQIAALKKAGCDYIFTDTASGATSSRPELTRCLASMRAGDMLVVWKLDRLGRSLSHLVTVLSDLQGKGVAFLSLTEAIDTESAAGRPKAWTQAVAFRSSTQTRPRIDRQGRESGCGRQVAQCLPCNTLQQSE